MGEDTGIRKVTNERKVGDKEGRANEKCREEVKG